MKKIKWYQTLAVRFSSAFILIILVVAAMIGFAEFAQDRQALHEELKATGLLLAINLAHSLSDYLIYEDHWYIHKELKGLVEGTGKESIKTRKISPVSYAEIKDKGGQPLVTYDPDGLIVRSKSSALSLESDPSKELSGAGDDLVKFLKTKDGSFYEITVPVLYIQQNIGSLRLGLTTRYVDLALGKMKVKIVMIVGAACILSVILPLFLFKNISSSIKKLSNVSLSIANGDFKKRSAYTNNDEIGILASTFNYMAGRLERFTRDIKEKNKALEKKNRELESFASTISHDLKNPLVTIEGYSGLLMDEVEGKLSSKEFWYLKRIKENAKFMERLIANILDLCRAENPHEELQDTSLLSIIQKAVNHHYQSKLQDKQIKIVLPEQMETVSYHPDRLYEVFSNLISNAVKFMKDQDHKEIKIEEEKKDGYLQIMVKDNGIGIDKKYYEKIFDPFDRLDTARNIEGTGIGLTIVKKIVESYGGKIWVKSELDKGSVFYFTIPMTRLASFEASPERAKEVQSV